VTDRILDLFSYQFALRGLLAGLCIGVACSALGVVLVLRRLSLIGDGLSHVTFLGAVVGLLLGSSPVYVAIPVVMASSLLILRLTEKTRMYGDTAIGMVGAFGVAGAVILASLGGGFNADIFGFLFGNILSVKTGELYASAAVLAVALGFMAVFYRELMSVSFDADFARTTGVNAGRLNVALVLVTSASIVLAIKMTGAMLTSSLIIVPAVTAIQAARGFKSAIIISCSLSAVSVLFGLMASFMLNLPSGATIILFNILFFLVSAPLKRLVHR
jgi:zinc transport system permease protein